MTAAAAQGYQATESPVPLENLIPDRQNDRESGCSVVGYLLTGTGTAGFLASYYSTVLAKNISEPLGNTAIYSLCIAILGIGLVMTENFYPIRWNITIATHN